MKKEEATTVVNKIRDILERHVGAQITPELATGILNTMSHDVSALVDTPPKKTRTPRKNKTTSK